MKEHIDTIPIWEAFRAECECPVCRLHSRTEADYREYFMGASVMEPDVRVETNRKGFCARHYNQMFRMSNRLGLALSTHTYLKEVISRVQADASQAPAPKKKGFFGKREMGAEGNPVDLDSSCILCERLDNTMQRYMETIFVLWKKETEFRKAFAGGKGFCLTHYRQLRQMAPENLSGAEADTFRRELCDTQLREMNRLEKELEWFTLKFDYRNADKPWGTSEDAVERTLNKLRVLSVPFKEDEPEARPK